MGKVTHIQKSRKEHKCHKCGAVIEVGQPYYKGVINFHPDIVRCEKCGLKSYEVTTSSYTKEVGAICEEWQKDYGTSDGTAEEIADALTGIKDECEESLDNMPEQLRDSDSGCTLQDRIDNLESVIDNLGEISYEDLKEEKREEAELNIDREEFDSDEAWEDAVGEELDSLAEEAYIEAIDEALSELEY